jgi:hypothetical protein
MLADKMGFQWARAKQAQVQTEITILLVWLIISLSVFALLFEVVLRSG